MDGLPMSYLDNNITVRLRSIERTEVSLLVKKNKEDFESEAHFIRCAILKFIREVKNGNHKAM